MTQEEADEKKMQELVETQELCNKRYCPFKESPPPYGQCDGNYCDTAFENWKNEHQEYKDMTRLTDNEVSEVAKMQKLIDDYEACMDYIYCLIYKADKDPIMVSHDNDIWWFRPIEKFARFVRHSHPELLVELRNKEQQELQEQTAMQSKPFWKRLFGVHH